MKNTLTALFAIITISIYGQSDLPIYRNIEMSSAFNWDEMSDNQILVPSPFGKPNLRIPKKIDFNKYQITHITYYYSQNKSNPDFGQSELSDQRYQNLMAAYPEINPSAISWSTKVQNECGNNECAEELFHGFVLELKKRAPVQKIQDPIGHHQIEDQSFRIKGEQETVIIGKDGTKILIPANAFNDSKGRIVNGNVTIKLKEAIHIEDIVLGNLNTITSSGEALVSKGMVKIEAFKGKYALELAEKKSLTVEIPTKFEEGYSYYKGETKAGNLTWTEPVKLKQNPQIRMNELSKGQWGFSYETKPYVEKVGLEEDLDTVVVHMWNQDLYFSKSDYKIDEAIRLGVKPKVARKIQKWFDKDQFNFDDVANKFYGSAWYDSKWLPFLWGPVRWDGMTSIFRRDTSEIGNVLAMNKLGWANIDCLASMKNLTKTRFNVAVESPSDINNFKIVLIVPAVNSMVPGFQRKNGNYSFTHGENEDMVQMPNNEKVLVMATGTKNNEQFFAVQEYKLGASPLVKLTMHQVNQKDMIEELKDKL